jgi:hypothetical protein
VYSDRSVAELVGEGRYSGLKGISKVSGPNCCMDHLKDVRRTLTI